MITRLLLGTCRLERPLYRQKTAVASKGSQHSLHVHELLYDVSMLWHMHHLKQV